MVKHKFYIIELVIILFIIILKLLSDKIPIQYIYLTKIIFIFIFNIFLFIIGGFPKDKNYYKRSSIKIIIIILLVYILIIYIFGLFIGFIKNLYFYNIYLLIKKILPITLFIINSEILRYLFFKHNPNKIQIIIFIFELILLNIIGNIGYNINDYKQLFIIISMFIIPIIASELVYSYITYNISLIPTIIYKLIYNIYNYLVPFTPDFSDYLHSIFGIIIPYVIYIEIKKLIRYKEKYNLYTKKTIKRMLSFIFITFLCLLIFLVSGIFKYQLIAIATGSMEPIYYRGDAVIIEKTDPDNILVGDILVYKINGGIVTHRVIEIIDKNGIKIYHTKGDNNLIEDNIDIYKKDIKGRVKYVVKYIGYPTIYFNELLESK